MPCQPIAGEASDRKIPDWRPLERLLGTDELCSYFMWMFEVVLADGRVVEVYKHSVTRRYLHLGVDAGAAYCYTAGGMYRQVARSHLLQAVFDGPNATPPTESEREAIADALDR